MSATITRDCCCKPVCRCRVDQAEHVHRCVYGALDVGHCGDRDGDTREQCHGCPHE